MYAFPMTLDGADVLLNNKVRRKHGITRRIAAKCNFQFNKLCNFSSLNLYRSADTSREIVTSFV